MGKPAELSIGSAGGPRVAARMAPLEKASEQLGMDLPLEVRNAPSLMFSLDFVKGPSCGLSYLCQSSVV